MKNAVREQIINNYKIYFENFTKKFDQLLVLNKMTFGIKNGNFY